MQPQIQKLAFLTATIFFALSLFLNIHSTANAAVPKTDTTNNFATQPTPNQVIVKYKKDLSPQALQLKVDDRKIQRSGAFGSIRLFFDNLKYRLNKQALPEDQLLRIQQADEKAGAKNKSRIFEGNDENQRNLFVVEIDQGKTIEDAIRIYEALPEVEYAEPNYTFYAF